MLEFLNNYIGDIIYENKVIDKSDIANLINSTDGSIKITLVPQSYKSNEAEVFDKRIEVEDWLLRQSDNINTFMLKWNNDIPLPLKIMDINIIKEERGIYYIKAIAPNNNIVKCTYCGRVLRTPESKLVGIGPECLRKIGLPNISINERKKILDKLKSIVWVGWIPKSAIINMEDIG